MIKPETYKICPCGKEFRRFNTLQNRCGECEVKRKLEKDGLRRRESLGDVRSGEVQVLKKAKGERKVATPKTGVEKKETFDHLKEAFGLDGMSRLDQSPIRKISDKKAKMNADLSKIKAAKIAVHGKTCESCGHSFDSITLSHYIPVSVRTNLELVPEASFLQCMDEHYHYEHLHGEYISKFMNLDKILAFLLENDIKRYNLVIKAINKAK